MSIDLAFFISGHGFGHASRDIEVINALLVRRPDLVIVVRTAAARWLFDLTLAGAVEFRDVECDTGMIQIDSLRIDEVTTIDKADAFYRSFDDLADSEASALRSLEPRLVVGDIPPLAFEAGHRAGIESVALGNFTWDWIYDGYRDVSPRTDPIVERIRRAYALAGGAWRLPLWGGFTSMHHVEDVPFIARHSHREPSEIRRALGLPLDRRLVLVSFGGYGLEHLELARLTARRGYVLITAERTAPASTSGTGATIISLDERRLYADGFRYEDLVHAADAVVTKPGYGIVAECIANRTALLYTSRGRFREYDVFVREMPRYLPCAFIDQERLLSGDWESSLDRLLATPWPDGVVATSGAEVVADGILKRLR